PYLNCVLKGRARTGDPLGLLQQAKQMEAQLGRSSDAPRWSPRVIDIDLLAFGDRCMEVEALTLPHPGLLKRAFVLFPLADIAPDWLYPEDGAAHGKTARMLADALEGCEDVHKTAITLE
ncbi:MAG: 2-amino-4-hydroxy-6-hydroxymethyldihydropteridine diphosphokinase, partial [Rickettsiales bacterium]|nr:2-amino-4-hydroxy-6-hydroxymethyldihydropteridine diphosphokinase [Rickettsiales bacterium]